MSPMWATMAQAHARPMHPFHSITLAQHHVDDLRASADRHRLLGRGRRRRGARSLAPPAAAGPAPLRFLPDGPLEPDERLPAA